MEYTLAIENTPETIDGGTGLLLVHPSIAETDRIDTDFLKTDTDHLLVISTRTTAREVEQKLEHYEVDETKATILDTLSIERGYTRRAGENIRYLSRPENLAGVIDETEEFLESHEGKLRVSADSITEMIYYADEQQAQETVRQLLALLEDHDAVGLFHLARGVHDETVLEQFRDVFDGVIKLDEDGNVTSSL